MKGKGSLILIRWRCRDELGPGFVHDLLLPASHVPLHLFGFSSSTFSLLLFKEDERGGSISSTSISVLAVHSTAVSAVDVSVVSVFAAVVVGLLLVVLLLLLLL